MVRNFSFNPFGGRIRRWVKLALWGLALVFVVGFGLAAWQVFHGDVVSGEEIRRLSDSALGTDTGSTSYIGRSDGYDHFRLRWMIRSNCYRVPESESPVKDPYPLRYWPGSWRQEVFDRNH